MKKLFLVSIILALTLNTNAQKEATAGNEATIYGKPKTSVFIKPEKSKDDIKTIFGDVKSRGFYMGADALFIDYGNWQGAGTNFRMGWILNHSFSFGFSGGYYGTPFTTNEYFAETSALKGGFGGINFEFAFLPKFPVHLTFPINIGIGGVSQVVEYNVNEWNYNQWDYYSNYRTVDSEMFAYAQGAAQLEVNLLKHLRLGIGLAYMQTNAMSFAGETKYAYSGPSGIFSIKVGKF